MHTLSPLEAGDLLSLTKVFFQTRGQNVHNGDQSLNTQDSVSDSPSVVELPKLSYGGAIDH